jgi:hypothetical protein
MVEARKGADVVYNFSIGSNKTKEQADYKLADGEIPNTVCTRHLLLALPYATFFDRMSRD